MKDDYDLDLYGNFFSNRASTLVIFFDFFRCNYCPSTEEVLTASDYQIYLQLYVSTPYVDFGDIEHPIKQSFDSYFFSDQENSGEFYTISNSQTSQAPYSKDGMAVLMLSLDNEVIHYERSVYNFFEMIGDVGGSFEFIKTICFMLIGGYTNKMYYYFSLNQMQNLRNNEKSYGRIL